MKESRKGFIKDIHIILSVLMVFCIFGLLVFSTARRISAEMSDSAVNNLNESLELLKGMVEATLTKEAEFQRLMAQEIAVIEEPSEFVRTYNRSDTMIKISLVLAGEREGVSNTGETFFAEELDFSSGKSIGGVPVSKSYLNDMGTWAYTMKYPAVKDEKELGTLYVEYIYDSFDDMLPDSFYNRQAMLYVMDADSRRFVLKPKGMGERAAGHMNLEDFCRANRILEEDVQEEISRSIEAGENVMFYHDILEKDSLVYMWAACGGTVYLVGYVPVEAIQREGATVSRGIFTVVAAMLAAFLLCGIVYYLNERQKARLRREREKEREMHSRQLAEALRTAEIANSSKTTFLSNMSHDIRTPMNAILGFTTLLTKDAENPAKVREYTKKITASGQHLLSLINDVLDVSKIESGKVVLTLGEFALNDILSSIDAIIRPVAKAKKQSFEIEVTGIRNGNLIGDETRINQILLNLLSNAVKYTPEGGSIWFRIIGLPQRSSQYEHIRIEVEDNGYGMTPEYLKVIFDAFTRAENSTTNKIQGTGLGMAITKNIVELMGGTIEVASEVDKGSIFTVELELRIADEGVEEKEKFWKRHRISRVLAVDDDLYTCKNIRSLMEDTGVQVDVALGGGEAVERALEAQRQGAPYHVILLDFKMPGMDGIETAQKLREVLTEPAMILLQTTYDWDECEEEADRAGIDGFLSKPFFVSALKEKVIELRAGQGDATAPAEEGGEDRCLEGRHFLVAEDNEINAEILSELLDIEGAGCEIAENGSLVVERFLRAAPEEFDAILMDVQMPVMDGYEATRAIRRSGREGAETIPIIAMTANAFAEDVKAARDAGMDAHVAKPIEMAVLKKTLNEYLQGKERKGWE